MKKLVLLLPLIILLACSVQKRKYQNGYYVDWRNKKSSGDKSLVQKNKTREQKEKTSTKNEIDLSTGDRAEATEANLRINSFLFKKPNSGLKHLPDSCDLIFFKDGSEISAKVEEIGTHEIKYKRCDNLNGPSYRTKKGDIFMIKYSNGNKEVIQPDKINTQAPPEVLVYKSNSILISHPAAETSLAIGILGMVYGFMLLVIAAVSELSGPIITTAGPYIIWLIIGILAASLAIWALYSISTNPDRFKGRGKAFTGLTFALIIAITAGAILINY